MKEAKQSIIGCPRYELSRISKVVGVSLNDGVLFRGKRRSVDVVPHLAKPCQRRHPSFYTISASVTSRTNASSVFRGCTCDVVFSNEATTPPHVFLCIFHVIFCLLLKHSACPHNMSQTHIMCIVIVCLNSDTERCDGQTKYREHVAAYFLSYMGRDRFDLRERVPAITFRLFANSMLRTVGACGTSSFRLTRVKVGTHPAYATFTLYWLDYKLTSNKEC